jgi:hypothetical protein
MVPSHGRSDASLFVACRLPVRTHVLVNVFYDHKSRLSLNAVVGSSKDSESGALQGFPACWWRHPESDASIQLPTSFFLLRTLCLVAAIGKWQINRRTRQTKECPVPVSRAARGSRNATCKSFMFMFTYLGGLQSPLSVSESRLDLHRCARTPLLHGTDHSMKTVEILTDLVDTQRRVWRPASMR